MKTVGVNRAPVRIFHLERVGDSGCDTFEKKNKKIRVLHLVVSEHLGSGLDPPIRSNKKGVLHM